LHDLAQPKNYALNVTARLRSGLKVDIAKSRLSVLGQRLTAIQPSGIEGAREVQIQKPSRFSMSTTPEDDGPVTLIGTLLMGMAGAVLIIASLNLANMLLARGTARAKKPQPARARRRAGGSYANYFAKVCCSRFVAGWSGWSLASGSTICCCIRSRGCSAQ
jgi:hypothetical protein